MNGKTYIVYSRADGEYDSYPTLAEASHRADLTAESLRDAGVNDTVLVWEESDPDNILYYGAEHLRH